MRLPVAVVYNPTNPQESALIPWFDKNLEYDGKLYFQSKGGWACYYKKDSTYEYEYTVSRIHYVETIAELYDLPYYKLDSNGLYYVGELKSYYKVKNAEQHDSASGWYTQSEIPESEITKAENIIDNNKGNNPHSGLYDGGETYLKAFNQLFKYSTFEQARTSDVADHEQYGFELLRVNDSTKCVYLSDQNITNPNKLRSKTSLLTPKNPFTLTNEFTEIAGTSIVNVKLFHITFDDAHEDFIKTDVLPYLKQMIPSTTIFSYNFERLTGDDAKSKAALSHQVICGGDSCPIYGLI
jgi:hypothetical protein